MRGASDGYPFAKPIAFEDVRHAHAVPVSDAIPEYIHADAHAVTDYSRSPARVNDAGSVALVLAVTEHDRADAVT